MRVLLVVDDEVYLLSLYKSIFEENGYDVYTATRDTEAFDMFYLHKPPVVIIDLNLGPNSLSGCEISKQMLTLRPETKIICVSGMMTMDFLGAEFKYGGFCAMVAKPVSAPELLAIVDEHYENP